MSANMKAPFPYFGSKSSVAHHVWAALGNVRHYIEPFCGTCAVLLARPDYDPKQHVETVNDADGHIANVWRSLKLSPDKVAEWADWPVNHADLMARKAEIIRNEDRLLQSLVADPMWHDPILAAYYIWASSCWIGSGLTRPSNQIPRICNAGTGINAKHNGLLPWFEALSARLRKVRVVCGDWTRVCGGNWQDSMGTVGIFFDPPYGAAATRDPNIYGKDSLSVADDVRAWCLERGQKKSYRIVLAGYYEEHQALQDQSWTVLRWKAQGGYGNQGNGQAKANRHREALFFSPHCLRGLPLLENGGNHE